MAKLGNIFEGNTFIITQTPHTFDRAIDCVGSNFNLVAPCDLKIDGQLYDQYGNPYFQAFNNNFMLRFVHSYVTVKPGIYPKGTIIGHYNVSGDAFPDHCHIAINVDGRWGVFMDYLDRNVELRLGAGFGNDTKYKNWSYWSDSHLNILNLVNNSNTHTKMDNTTITVPQNSGWGISHLAQAAGYNASDQSKWTYIANLNGYNKWEDLHALFTSGAAIGRTFKVRESIVEPVPTLSVLKDDKQLSELKKKLEAQKKAARELEDKLLAEQAQKEVLEAEYKKKEVAKLEEQRKQYLIEKDKLEQRIIKLQDEFEGIDRAIDLRSNKVVETIAISISDEIEEAGLFDKYGEWVDRRFKSNTMKSLLKYDIFVGLGWLLSQASLIAFVNDLSPRISAGISLVVAIVLKILLTRYDRNKDGVLDVKDLTI